MKAEEITFKSTDGNGANGNVRYRVLFSGIPEYAAEAWTKLAEGICPDEELPALEMEAVITPDNQLEETEVKYYFDDYEEFELEDSDLETMKAEFKKIIKKEGDKLPDAYDYKTGLLMGDGEWMDLAERFKKEKCDKPCDKKIERNRRLSEILAVERLCKSIGYGNVMDIASGLWAIKEGSSMNVPSVEGYLTKEGKAVARAALNARIEEIKAFPDILKTLC